MALPVQDTGRTSRNVWVWLPPGVQDSPALPVVYLLPGQYETPRTPFQSGIADVLARQFAAGLPPFELVVPDGVSATRSDPEWADAWDGADNLETFLAQQVVPAVEGSTPRPRSLRAVTGFSMGGYGAAVDAARKNTLFGQFVGMAGYYHLDDPQHVLGPNATYRYVHTPLARADQYDATRVLLLDNTQDQTTPMFAAEVYRMRDALASAGHRPCALVTSGAHSWAWATSVLPLAVRFLSQGWGH